MPSSEEDGPKKRQVQSMPEETPKKVRVDAAASQKRRSKQTTSTTAFNKVPPPNRTNNVASKPKQGRASKNPPPSKSTPPSSSPILSLEKIRSMWKDKNRRVWDLEGALLYLVQELDEKEYLTHDEFNWVTFRVGHAGDASKIASWYRLAKEEQQILEQVAKLEEQLEEEDPEIETGPVAAQVEEEINGESNGSTGANMLEVWLADGFGDDRGLPFVYSLVANVHHIPKVLSKSKPAKEDKTEQSTLPKKEEKDKGTMTGERKGNTEIAQGDLKKSAVTKELGAVALLTMGFDDETLEKTLRIEWMALNPDLSTEVLTVLRQRVWLRLSTLSVMTACQGGIEWEQRYSLDPLKRQQELEEKQKQQKMKAMKESDKKPAARVSPRAE